MGYACPVCETPQRDGEHLAHHLAFTAMLHGDDHESWLDEHVADWAAREPAELAAAVAPHADEAEYHEVFEDTVDRGRPDVDVGSHAHGDHGHAHAHGNRAAPTGLVDESGATDPEVADALREARELTRELYEEESEGENGDSDGGETAADESENDNDGDASSA